MFVQEDGGNHFFCCIGFSKRRTPYVNSYKNMFNIRTSNKYALLRRNLTFSTIVCEETFTTSLKLTF